MGGRAHSRIDTFEQDHFLPNWSLVPVGPSTTNVVCGNAVPKAGYARKPPGNLMSVREVEPIVRKWLDICYQPYYSSFPATIKHDSPLLTFSN